MTCFRLSAIRSETGTFTGEPARESLTAPPAGYQTPSPAQPYGIGRRTSKGQGSDGRRPRRGSHSLTAAAHRRRTVFAARASPVRPRPVPWRVRPRGCGPVRSYGRTPILLKRLTTLAALAVVASALAGAVATAAAGAPQISHFTLSNGLEVVVIPDHRAPVVTHMVWYKVGSADETPGKSGLAHFLEHLMFKGTDKNPSGRFSQVVATIGGQENAFTSADYTGYFQRVPRDKLKPMMEFEADRMTGLALTDDVVRPELNVVLEEQNMRVANNPGARLRRADGCRALSEPSLWQAGDRLAARDRTARPRGGARVLPALLHAQQRHPGGRRRRDRRRGPHAGRRDLRQGRRASPRSSRGFARRNRCSRRRAP